MSSLVSFEKTLLQSPQYSAMQDIIATGLPEVTRATNLFQKSQSQFMDNMLTVSHITPIRNLRQILAEMKKTRMALGEAYYNVEKKKLDIEEKKIALTGSSGIVQRRLDIEIAELEWQISCIMENVGGAVRKLANYTLQYQAIIKEHGLENFDEEAFESEEEKYHITKAFEQGLNAARAHGGFIDEGNQIYLEQIGVNGTVAQIEVSNYLNLESYMLSPVDGHGNKKDIVEPSHEMQIEFLLRMAEKFEGCSQRYAKWKGMPDTKQVDALLRSKK